MCRRTSHVDRSRSDPSLTRRPRVLSDIGRVELRRGITFIGPTDMSMSACYCAYLAFLAYAHSRMLRSASNCRCRSTFSFCSRAFQAIPLSLPVYKRGWENTGRQTDWTARQISDAPRLLSRRATEEKLRGARPHHTGTGVPWVMVCQK